MQAVRLTIPAKPEFITLGRLALTGIARLRPEQFSEEVLGDLKLALTEACTNSVRHAYDDDGRLGRDHVRAARRQARRRGRRTRAGLRAAAGARRARRRPRRAVGGRSRHRDHRRALRRVRDHEGRRRRLDAPLRQAAQLSRAASVTRPLIVVSNRGPVAYDRDASGRACRAAGRRRAGHRAARAARAPRRHVDRERARRRGSRGRAKRARAEEGVVLIAHEPKAYDGYYNVIANPLLWFMQHSLWGLAHRVPTSTAAFHEAWRDGYDAVNEAFAAEVVAELDDKPGRRRLLPRLPPLPRAATRPRGATRRRARALRPHPVAEPTGRAAASRCARAVFDGLLANDVVGFHTARWAHNFAQCELRRVPAAQRTRVTHHPISVDVAEFDELARERRRARARSGRSSRRPEKLIVRVDRTDPSKNIVRGFEAFALLLDEHPEWRGRVTMLALLDPSRQDDPRVRRLPRGGRAARLPRQRAVRHRRLAAHRSAGRGQLPAVGRRVQAIRRAPRERGLRRAQPGREGGAARQHPRRRARALGERRRARGARRVGAVGQPVRRRRAGRRAARGADDGRAERGRRAAAVCAARAGQRRQRVDRGLLADIDNVSRNVRR